MADGKRGGGGPAGLTQAEFRGAKGAIQTLNHIVNLTVVSKDANDLAAEYAAGVVQGKLQGGTIVSARDNTWDNAYLTDPDHGFPKQPGPSAAERQYAQGILLRNYDFLLQYLSSTTTPMAARLKRLLFRMLGIYHGATGQQSEKLDFSGGWLPDRSSFREQELLLTYETENVTFLDVYFINAACDLSDLVGEYPPLAADEAPVRSTHRQLANRSDHCSAFVKRYGNDELLLTHNSWMGFLSQTMSQTIAVNTDWCTFNAATPGLIGSGTDFGYNNKGLLFNETTHRASKMQPRLDGIWMFWRAALAEQYSGSIDEFIEALSLDNTGTYLNGYMVVDATTRETCLVEMSFRCFVYYRFREGKLFPGVKCLDGAPCSTGFDEDMVNARHFKGINFPASHQVRADLQSTDNRPARRKQFEEGLPHVGDVESAKKLITHVDPKNPLSIFGRWDLGYGETSFPKMVPDGSVDAKVATTEMVRAFMKLSGEFDASSKQTGFWMLYGTPSIHGKPFVWSESSWSWQKLRDVPDRLDGSFTLMPLLMR